MSERERFEAWVLSTSTYHDKTLIEREEDGKYDDPDVRYAWESWQAALADRPEQPVAWADLQGPAITIDEETAKHWAAAGRPITVLYAAPVARPEPAQPVAYAPATALIPSTAYPPDAGAFVVSKARNAEYSEPLYAAPPSHPAPSEPLCPSCKGSGEMEIMERVEGTADQAWPVTVDCYRCGGTGVAPSEAGAERQEQS